MWPRYLRVHLPLTSMLVQIKEKDNNILLAFLLSCGYGDQICDMQRCQLRSLESYHHGHILFVSSLSSLSLSHTNKHTNRHAYRQTRQCLYVILGGYIFVKYHQDHTVALNVEHFSLLQGCAKSFRSQNVIIRRKER